MSNPAAHERTATLVERVRVLERPPGHADGPVTAQAAAVVAEVAALRALLAEQRAPQPPTPPHAPRWWDAAPFAFRGDRTPWTSIINEEGRLLEQARARGGAC